MVNTLCLSVWLSVRQSLRPSVCLPLPNVNIQQATLFYGIISNSYIHCLHFIDSLGLIICYSYRGFIKGVFIFCVLES